MHLYRTVNFTLDDIIYQQVSSEQLTVTFHNDGCVTTNNVTPNAIVQTNQQFLDSISVYENNPRSTVLRGDIIKTFFSPSGPDDLLIENNDLTIE